MTRLCTVILKYSQSGRDQERKSSANSLGRESLRRRKDRYVSAIRTETEKMTNIYLNKTDLGKLLRLIC